MVPVIDTLPSTQTNSAKEDSEIAQKNYAPSEMFQDLKNQRTIFEVDALLSGKRLKANQPKNFSYPKKKFGIEEVFCLLGMINGPRYTTAKLETVYIASFVKTATIIIIYNMLNDIRVENSFITTGYSNWKHARSTYNGFHQHGSSNCYQQAIQRLIEISTSTEVQKPK